MLKIGLIFVLLFTLGVLLFDFPGKSKILSPEISSLNLVKSVTSEVQLPKPTLEKIFLEEPAANILDKDKIITVIATGDVIPARSVNFHATRRKNFNWPYEKTKDVLKSADITFINLETPLIQNCPLTQEGMIFCGDFRSVDGLVYAGVDVATLANNHAGNWGSKGLRATDNLLKIRGIHTTGNTNSPGAAYKFVKGINFAFLGYNDIEKTSLVSSAEDGKIKSEIGEARRNADVVIVQFHWGTEYMTEPEERQRYLGELAIDSGADLVIGNHPHWIKPVEFYKDKLITYAHGNFVFDQEWSQKTKEGVVGKYTFYEKDLIGVEFLPIEIVDYGQPYFLEGAKKKKILDEMYQESLKLK